MATPTAELFPSLFIVLGLSSMLQDNPCLREREEVLAVGSARQGHCGRQAASDGHNEAFNFLSDSKITRAVRWSLNRPPPEQTQNPPRPPGAELGNIHTMDREVHGSGGTEPS